MKRMWSRNELKQQNNANTIDLLGSGQVPSIKAGEIIENMSGYSFEEVAVTTGNVTITPVYVGACKNGNKLTLVYFAKVVLNEASTPEVYGRIANFNIPSSIGEKLYPSKIGSSNIDALVNGYVKVFTAYESGVDLPFILQKSSNTQLGLILYRMNNLTAESTYNVRLEFTFLLSDNLVPQE